MKETVSIRILSQDLERLRKLKVISSEPYSSVIERILDVYAKLKVKKDKTIP